MSFTLTKKEVRAHPYRVKGSTLLENDTNDLKIVYHKYKTNSPPPKPVNQLRFNLIFCHGTGFNKSIWKYHIKKLYQLSQSMQVPWFLDSVIAIDALGHGDSALANAGKLGPVFAWDDGAKDVLEVIKHEIETTGDFQNNAESRNVIVGHSMGGFIALYAAFLEASLFDSVIPIEAVFYGQIDGLDKFKKIFNKIKQMMIDTFDSHEDALFYFTKFSFTKKFQKEVMKDYLEDELIEVKDPETGDVQIKCKCNKQYQVAGYFGAFISISKGMLALPSIKVPILHVIGAKGAWNPPESTSWIRETIYPKYFAGGVDIPNGEHLVNAEQPDDIVDTIATFLTQRNDQYKKEKSEEPESVFKGDKEAIANQEFSKLVDDLDLDNIYGFELERRDLFNRGLKAKI
ncbi:uncharacterized protein KGF55_002378 [Candida pseudojiufengensis]|uniref:uncharacterized protein n=1 Tax=Candida pseudojiufengensis TaxID=497109 RepID=UPI00222444C0|nr:uncharacterized protein KGF55_002378 [Candida pseudojiufengensis]KAI5963498.1 hypothetical protein KGF55_002378 [Candida pseudojiufengensis]